MLQCLNVDMFSELPSLLSLANLNGHSDVTKQTFGYKSDARVSSVLHAQLRISGTPYFECVLVCMNVFFLGAFLPSFIYVF